MSTGTIKRIVSDRGFGFLHSAEFPDDDLFFHHSQLRDLPFDNRLIDREVEFEHSTNNGRGRAVNIYAKSE